MSNSFEQKARRLLNSPIVEVVCGIQFEPISSLDTLTLGVFWDHVRADFALGAMQPAFMDSAPNIVIGGGVPMRAVLHDESSEFFLQLQSDRFFMNWKKVGGEYPRFSSKDGLSARFEREFERLQSFLHDRLGASVNVTGVTLTKVDLLERGQHWKNRKDLASLMPATHLLESVMDTPVVSEELNLRFSQQHADNRALSVAVSSARNSKTVKLDTTYTTPANSDWKHALASANLVLNTTFFELVKDAKQRFGEEDNG